MPALATKPTSSSVHHPSPHKHRVSRRRGRANGFHSDDEIDREARSDSDTDEDDQSSADSESDSETEPVSEDAPQHGHPSLLSPGTTPPVINDSKDDNNHAPLLAASVTWSEMVADQVANGTTDLPVIDFADLDNSPIHAKLPRAPVPRKAPKSKRPPPQRRSSAPPVSSEPPSEPPVVPASPSPPSRAEPNPVSASVPHRRGQTARQAYQERLENDPSYVPTVGEFWGHDDRLLDKNLRSLSGWWRGRWQGGARGRSFGVRGRGRGRGRGSPNTAHDSHPNHDSSPPSQVDVPPVDRPWTHDGFEELKRREEQRSQRQDQSQGSNGNSRGSRSGFTPRGRPSGRGRFSPRPATTRSTESPSSMTSRTWFLVKPERPWTKHHELFLYSDPSQCPRPGQGPTYRVKLSGTSPETIVQSSTQRPPPRAPTPPREAAHEDGELVFIVSLPRGERKPEAAENTLTPAAAPPPPSSVLTPSPEQVVDAASVQVSSPSLSPAIPATVVVKPESPPKLHVVIEQPVATSEPPAGDPFKLRDPPPPTIIPLPTTTPTQVNPVASASGAAVSPSAPAPIPHSATAPEGGLLWRSPPPHLQTAFAQSAPAPGYASPYTYAPVSAPTVPPGVALDAHGMPYELATGRPLYLAAPPPQVHTPVYMMPYPHLPSHMQHRPHASPDPSLFAPPRQSSRIEIRRPDAPSEESRLSSTHPQTHMSRPSALRTSTSAPAFIPSHAPGSQPPPAPHEFYPSPPPEVPAAPAPAAVMGYAAYSQPPYYAYGAAEGYAYPPPQFVEYDAYGADLRGAAPAATQAVYY
jgi:CASC3/Barentsz eIF4AIII binding